MKDRKEECVSNSRRNMLKGPAILFAGGIAGRISGACYATASMPQAAPPLPWKWVKLDPMEAGRRAYRAYLEKKG